MEDSPTGYVSSQQVPLVSWDMESPNTSVISPRSITLPWPENCGEASPATRIADWQISHRNKRRIRRVPQQTNVFKRYGLLTDTPEKSSESSAPADIEADNAADDEFDEFDDDLDDETIAQIRLTPIQQQHQQGTKRPPKGGTEGVTKSGQVFKTPTNFKSQGRTRRPTGEKVLPRKLTAEFDYCAKQEEPATSAASSSRISPMLPQPQGNSLSQQMITTKLRTQVQDDDDEAMMSGDDEMVQQAVQLYNNYLASQIPANTAAAAPAVVTQEEENKENSRTDDYIDSDDALLDDLMSDDFVMQIKAPSPPRPSTLRTPPQSNSPEGRKRARLSLSLTKRPRL